MAKRNVASAKLKWELWEYNPAALRKKPESEVRQEYSRLRKIAIKRLARFRGTEFEDTQSYLYNKDRYVTLKEIPNRTSLNYLLSDLGRFIAAKTSTISGLKEAREKAIEKLHKHDYTFVTKENFKDFGEFMEYAGAVAQNKIYDSERVAEWWEENREKHKDRESLEKAFFKWQKKNLKRKTKNRRTR